QYPFRYKDVVRVLYDAKIVFSKEPTLLECGAPAVIVGDLHGQYSDLLRIFASFDEKRDGKTLPGYRNHRYIFLGDYVDRGNQSVEVIMLLFMLKIKLPNKFILLRGNHETSAINKKYGLREEVDRRFHPDDSSAVFDMLNEVFTHMPLACRLGKKIMCMHGGISPKLRTLQDIVAIPKPLIDPNTDDLARDLLWADPMIGLKGWAPNNVRGISLFFGEDALRETMKRLGIDLVVRGHQMAWNGYRFYDDRRLLTIFSAPGYSNKC
ncbi:hypothetical protein PFISCL1PPCAC_8613, partial [Pristionchus fissidentatus]